MVLGLKLAVTPVGRPEAARLTLWLKPPITVLLMVALPELPCRTVSTAGEVFSVKFGAGVTVMLSVEVCCTVPPLPVMVMVKVPVGVVVAALSVRVADPDPGAEMVLGLKLAVTPEGNPVADRLTAWLKPATTLDVMVALPELPCWMESEDGDAAKVKFGASVTVRPTVAVCCKLLLPPLPMMLTV